MNTKQILEELRGQYQELLLADGFDEAIIGIVEGWIGQRRGEVVAYDYDKCLAILEERDGMDPESGEEFFQFNTVGAYVGEQTPLFVHDWRGGTAMSDLVGHINEQLEKLIIETQLLVSLTQTHHRELMEKLDEVLEHLAKLRGPPE